MSSNPLEVFRADSQDPSSLCGGGKTFQECGTAQTLMELFKNIDLLPEPTRNQLDNRITGRSVKHFLPVGCTACKQICEITVGTTDGDPNDQGSLLTARPETFFELPVQKLVWQITAGKIEASIAEDRADKIIGAQAKNTTDTAEFFDTIDAH